MFLCTMQPLLILECVGEQRGQQEKLKCNTHDMKQGSHY
jgi:hypothetical protein